SLLLQPEFFPAGITLHVFPDQAILGTYSTVTSDDLAGATDWNGTPIVRPEYAQDTEDIAQTMQNTVGRQQNVSGARLRSSSTVGAAARRNLAPGDVPSWQVSIQHGASYTF